MKFISSACYSALLISLLTGCNPTDPTYGLDSTHSGTNVARNNDQTFVNATYDRDQAPVVNNGNSAVSGADFWAGNLDDTVTVSFGGTYTIARVNVFTTANSSGQVEILGNGVALTDSCTNPEQSLVGVINCTIAGRSLRSVTVRVKEAGAPMSVWIYEIEAWTESPV